MSSTTPAVGADRMRWIALLTVSLAVSLIIVDSTIINVAIPKIVDELHITSTQVQWVQESYTLVFAALLLTLGSLADRIGRRRLLAIGVVIFVIASIVAALAPSGEALIASRVVQGVGGAIILPTSLAVLNATFQGRERGIAFAVWGSTIGGMAAVGPLLGGWLTEYYSWRWAFGINVPIGILILVGIIFVVRESRAAQPDRLDPVGALLSIVLFGSLVFGLIEGRTYGWWLSDTPPGFWTFDLSPIPFVFALTVIALVAFLLWGGVRRRRGLSSMVAPDLFAIGSFRGGNIVALIVSLGEFGIILSLPLWLQNVVGFGALGTGQVLLALAIGAFIASGLAGAFGSKFAPVWIVRAGILLEIVGLVVIALVITVDTPWWQTCIGLLIYGLGVGFATAQLTGVILVDVPVDRSGAASATQSTARQVGSALGIAILGTVLFTSLGTVLADRLPATMPANVRTQIVDAVVNSAGSAIASFDPASPEAVAAREAFSEATRASAFTAAGFLGVGLVATASLGRGRKRPANVSGSA
ncbi:MAG: DHA2 family efflux MFS transporter permease subunit [Pseudolysinimonas sp.]|uniref:DHA2 family efflux MFS transporter permease subunit n=1 Tax=Pseudolysinimonas sp. TaxID=2680009 RepID=UPI0032661925